MAAFSSEPRSITDLVTKNAGKPTDMATWRVEEMMDKYRRLLALFESVVGRDGALDAKGFYKVMHSLDPNITQKMVMQVFAVVDRTGAGFVNFRDLLDYIFRFDDLRDATTQFEGLVDFSVHVRIVPRSVSAGYTHPTGRLAWHENVVTIGEQPFKFPGAVMPPECSQEAANKTLLPVLLDYWIMKGNNVVLLVYGGSESIFGTREALQSGDRHRDSGMVSYIVDTWLKRTAGFAEILKDSRDYVSQWILTASAIEFNGEQCVDLLFGRAPIILDDRGFPLGANSMRIDCLQDVWDYYDVATAGTGSSEQTSSHRMFFFTNYNHGKDIYGSYGTGKDGLFLSKMTFALVDVSSAVSPLITSELTLFKNEAENARDRYCKRKRYSPIHRKDGASDFVRFLCAHCLTGDALLGMSVCLSQSIEDEPQSVFACSLGQTVASTQVPLKKRGIRPYQKALDEATHASEKAGKALKLTSSSGDKGAEHVWNMRNCQANGAAKELQIIKDLRP